jgi:hypothetical protein
MRGANKHKHKIVCSKIDIYKTNVDRRTGVCEELGPWGVEKPFCVLDVEVNSSYMQDEIKTSKGKTNCCY